MDRIEKLTTTHDETEDRLHLLAQDSAGRRLGLWLTYRLASRLITALLKVLDQTVAHVPDTHARTALQAWEQSVAYAQHSPSAPVSADPGVEHGLLYSVDLTHNREQFHLVLRWPPDRAVLLVMNRIELRQWLRVLHQLYWTAEWPCDGVWPGWFSNEAPELTPGQGETVVH